MSVTNKRFQCPPNFQSIEPNSELLINDTSEKELWFIRAPLEFNPKSLNGQTLNLQGNTDIFPDEEGSKVYRCSSNQIKNVQFIQGVKNEGLLPVPLPVTGQITISETFQVPNVTIPSPSVNVPEVPEGVFARYTVFGSGDPVVVIKGSPEKSQIKKRKKAKGKTSTDEDKYEHLNNFCSSSKKPTHNEAFSEDATEVAMGSPKKDWPENASHSYFPDSISTDTYSHSPSKKKRKKDLEINIKQEVFSDEPNQSDLVLPSESAFENINDNYQPTLESNDTCLPPTSKKKKQKKDSKVVVKEEIFSDEPNQSDFVLPSESAFENINRNYQATLESSDTCLSPSSKKKKQKKASKVIVKEEIFSDEPNQSDLVLPNEAALENINPNYQTALESRDTFSSPTSKKKKHKKAPEVVIKKEIVSDEAKDTESCIDFRMPSTSIVGEFTLPQKIKRKHNSDCKVKSDGSNDSAKEDSSREKCKKTGESNAQISSTDADTETSSLVSKEKKKKKKKHLSVNSQTDVENDPFNEDERSQSVEKSSELCIDFRMPSTSVEEEFTLPQKLKRKHNADWKFTSEGSNDTTKGDSSRKKSKKTKQSNTQISSADTDTESLSLISKEKKKKRLSVNSQTEVKNDLFNEEETSQSVEKGSELSIDFRMPSTSNGTNITSPPHKKRKKKLDLNIKSEVWSEAANEVASGEMKDLEQIDFEKRLNVDDTEISQLSKKQKKRKKKDLDSNNQANAVSEDCETGLSQASIEPDDITLTRKKKKKEKTEKQEELVSGVNIKTEEIMSDDMATVVAALIPAMCEMESEGIANNPSHNPHKRERKKKKNKQEFDQLSTPIPLVKTKEEPSHYATDLEEALISSMLLPKETSILSGSTKKKKKEGNKVKTKSEKVLKKRNVKPEKNRKLNSEGIANNLSRDPHTRERKKKKNKQEFDQLNTPIPLVKTKEEPHYATDLEEALISSMLLPKETSLLSSSTKKKKKEGDKVKTKSNKKSSLDRKRKSEKVLKKRNVKPEKNKKSSSGGIANNLSRDSHTRERKKKKNKQDIDQLNTPIPLVKTKEEPSYYATDLEEALISSMLLPKETSLLSSSTKKKKKEGNKGKTKSNKKSSLDRKRKPEKTKKSSSKKEKSDIEEALISSTLLPKIASLLSSSFKKEVNKVKTKSKKKSSLDKKRKSEKKGKFIKKKSKKSASKKEKTDTQKKIKIGEKKKKQV